MAVQYRTAKREPSRPAAGNQSGNLTTLGRKLCLPPDSSLNITRDQIKISTPICTVQFLLEPTEHADFAVHPRLKDKDLKLPNGERRLEATVTGIHAVVEFPWIRSQHRDMKKYEEWANRVVHGALG
jgi:hypothetical protein